MGKREKVANEIVKLLKKDQRGLTIQEISQLTSVSRITASVALAKLEGLGKLDVRVIGNCKLHYLNEKVKGVKNA